MSGVSGFALTLILAAALLHAVWNAVIKGAGDRMLTMAMINFGHALVGIVMVILFAPPARAAWGFIALSTAIHVFYYAFLLLSYRLGDLSTAYPVARGIAPVLVALGAQAFAGETLPKVAWIGLGLVSGGICLLLLERRHAPAWGAVGAALLTGLAIAAYSVTDGMGVRASTAPLGYIGWLFLIESCAGLLFLWLRRSALPTVRAGQIIVGLSGGVLSALAYGLAIYAKSIAPLGAVSAIRESSVIIAALIGVFWFGERPWKFRLAAAAVVASGVVVLAAAG